MIGTEILELLRVFGTLIIPLIGIRFIFDFFRNILFKF